MESIIMTAKPEPPNTSQIPISKKNQVELIFGPDVGIPYEPLPNPNGERAVIPEAELDQQQVKEAENEGLAPKVPHDPDKRKPIDIPS
jgi:hypothetical protein